MLRSLKAILGYAVTTADTIVGELDDFLFDDRSWRILYAVIDAGGWLLGRKIAISADSLRQLKLESRALQIGLSRLDVEQSPDLDDHMPVSHQHRVELGGYYGWSASLAAEAATPRPFFPSPIPAAEQAALQAIWEKSDSHLRSAREVVQYHVEGQTGEIGRMKDFLLDDERWEIVSFLVDTRKWLPGPKVLIPSTYAHGITWQLRKVLLHTGQGSEQHFAHVNSL